MQMDLDHVEPLLQGNFKTIYNVTFTEIENFNSIHYKFLLKDNERQVSCWCMQATWGA